MGHEPYIREIPGSTQAVLMIHGIVGTPRHFDRLLPYVPAYWSVYNILLDGHGGTPKDFSHTSMKKWKAQVEQVLSDLCRRYSQVVVIAHSMGTLLTLGAASRYPQVTALILLNVPLCPWVRPVMIPRLLKLCFGKTNPDNIWEQSLTHAAGVLVTRKLWQYLGFIPRYIELLRLCRQSRQLVPGITLPCHVFFSVHDELVSMRSHRFFLGHPTVHSHILPNSGHFYYSAEDLPAIAAAMQDYLKP